MGFFTRTSRHAMSVDALVQRLSSSPTKKFAYGWLASPHSPMTIVDMS